MHGIAVSLVDEPRAPIDAQFPIMDRFCKFYDMPLSQGDASFSIFVIFLTNSSSTR